jgi:hypothetical protein
MKSVFGIAAFLAMLGFSPFAQAQSGPYGYDYLFPSAWDNPVKDVPLNAVVSPHNPSDVTNATEFVATTQQLGQGHKNYYVFQDFAKNNGTVEIKYLTPHWRNVTLHWSGYTYPDGGTDYEAIDFSLYNQDCFQSLSGPYTSIPDTVVYVGQVNGFPMLAFFGLGRRMGKAFSSTQINNVKDRNKVHNGGTLKSDFRSALVNEFLSQNPLVNPADIPIDTNFSSSNANVGHIIPSICPKDAFNPDGPSGHGCGRNSYRNAMVLSSSLKSQLASAMPAPGLIMYMEYLGAKYAPKAQSQSGTPQKFYYQEITDVSQIRNAEVERISEEETRFLVEYSKFLELTSGEPTPAPPLEIPRTR